MNGRRWHIVAVNGNSASLMRSDGSYALGMCDGNRRIIYVNSALHGAKLKKVLIHEITHACMFSYGINLGLETEEVFCDLMATHGTRIIKTADRILDRA